MGGLIILSKAQLGERGGSVAFNGHLTGTNPEGGEVLLGAGGAMTLAQKLDMLKC